MRKIITMDDMPNHVAAFLKQSAAWIPGPSESIDIFECKDVAEFDRKTYEENVGSPTYLEDSRSGRHFLVSYDDKNRKSVEHMTNPQATRRGILLYVEVSSAQIRQLREEACRRMVRDNRLNLLRRK